MSVPHYKYTPRKCRKCFRLPVELEDLSDLNLPLYVSVALWGLCRGKSITVRDVQQAFCISIRRASDILNYMTERGSGVVETKCNLRPLKQGDRRMRREWRVVAVYGGRIRVSKSRLSKKNIVLLVNGINSQHAHINELRRWFAGRHPGNVVPDNLLNVK